MTDITFSTSDIFPNRNVQLYQLDGIRSTPYTIHFDSQDNVPKDFMTLAIEKHNQKTAKIAKGLAIISLFCSCFYCCSIPSLIYAVTSKKKIRNYNKSLLLSFLAIMSTISGIIVICFFYFLYLPVIKNVRRSEHPH